MFFYIIENLILSLLIILPLLGAIAFFTLAERKLMASIQRRVGPNVVGWFGLLQPIADGLKLIIKETIIPSKTNRFLFAAAPGIVFFFSLIPWAVIPFEKTAVFMDTTLSLLFIFTITSLGVYGVVFGGWASNSKYAFLGAIRSTIQIISYELVLGLVLASISLLSGSFNLIIIVLSQKNTWNIFSFFPLFLIFLLVILIETNRSPADLPESESELVAGYSIDYSAIGFAMFFLGEYSNMLIMSNLVVILFLGGWLPPKNIILTINQNFNLVVNDYYLGFFSIKTVLVCFYFIWVRATVPRLRYDFLLNLGWKKLLPITFSFFIVAAAILLITQSLPLREFFIIRF